MGHLSLSEYPVWDIATKGQVTVQLTQEKNLVFLPWIPALL
jgi:hypothetical protein